MVAAMGRAAAAEEGDVEFVDYDQDDEDAMEEDGRAAGALPVPRIVSPAVVRTRGRFAGRSPSVLTSSSYRFDSITNDGDHGPGPQRCENPFARPLFGMISRLQLLVGVLAFIVCEISLGFARCFGARFSSKFASEVSEVFAKARGW